MIDTTFPFNDIHLHSPKTVRLDNNDLIEINLQSNRLYNKKIDIPILPNNTCEPLIHVTTCKTNLLTTKLLHPKTSLPPTFLSPASPIMPIFKNRLHRTNAIRKLFEDVQISNLTHANAQILPQRLFSMAIKPILPGYNLDEGLTLL